MSKPTVAQLIDVLRNDKPPSGFVEVPVDTLKSAVPGGEARIDYVAYFNKDTNHLILSGAPHPQPIGGNGMGGAPTIDDAGIFHDTRVVTSGGSAGAFLEKPVSAYQTEFLLSTLTDADGLYPRASISLVGEGSVGLAFSVASYKLREGNGTSGPIDGTVTLNSWMGRWTSDGQPDPDVLDIRTREIGLGDPVNRLAPTPKMLEQSGFAPGGTPLRIDVSIAGVDRAVGGVMADVAAQETWDGLVDVGLGKLPDPVGNAASWAGQKVIKYFSDELKPLVVDQISNWTGEKIETSAAISAQAGWISDLSAGDAAKVVAENISQSRWSAMQGLSPSGLEVGATSGASHAQGKTADGKTASPGVIDEPNAAARQQTEALKDSFIRGEVAYANSHGPDGQPWGTRTPTAPNATTEWARSYQPGALLHTTRVQSGADTETRITKVVDQARWEVKNEYVHERTAGSEILVGTTDAQSGKRWTLDRSSGQMQMVTLDAEATAQARMAPAVQNHRAMSNPQLQQCHRDEAERFTQSMKGVAALATGQAAVGPGIGASANEQRFDPQQRDQAIEDGMGQFRRATAELLSARQEMRERGMEVPEVTDVPDLSRLRELAQQQKQQQAQASVKQAPELTTLQQRHRQLAQQQLEPAMREHGYSTEQIERVSAAAVSHVQQVAHRGPAHTFMLSRDGASVAVLQERAPMSEFSVQEAQRQSPQQHLEQAHALAQQQEQSRVDNQHEQRQVQHGQSQRLMA